MSTEEENQRIRVVTDLAARVEELEDTLRRVLDHMESFASLGFRYDPVLRGARAVLDNNVDRDNT